MDETRAFLVLGIGPERDEGKIRRAYREKLRNANPEDDPEGFKELRGAYEAALRWARASEPEEPAADPAPEDQWEERLGRVYGRLSSRLDVGCWRELLDDELCVSLDTAEECRRRLLRFLTEHFRLSTPVWHYLDRVWDFTGRARELYEEYPGNFADFLLSACREGSWFPMEAFRGDDGADYDQFLSLYFEMDSAVSAGELDRAEELIGQMDGLGISHPLLELDRARCRAARGKKEEAVSLAEQADRDLPGDRRAARVCGLVMWEAGEKDRAAGFFERLVAADPRSVTGNRMLGRYWMEKGDLERAKEYTLEALDGGAEDQEAIVQLREINEPLIIRYRRLLAEDPEAMGPALELGWCCLQNGRPMEALALLAGRTPDEADAEEYHDLMGKLYYSNDQPERALEQLLLWKECLEREHGEGCDRTLRRLVTANSLIGSIYRKFGENGDVEAFGKALAHIDRARELGSRGPSCWMEKANIYKCRGEATGSREDYESAVRTLTELIREDGSFFPAYVLRQECWAALRDARGVIEDFFSARELYAGSAPIYERAAEVYSALERWSDLEELLREAGENGALSFCLRVYGCRMRRELAEGDEEALPVILEEMEKLRGEMDAADERREEDAPAAADRARLDAEICIALSALEKPEEALEAIRRAQRLCPEESRYHWIGGNLLRGMGRCGEALKSYEKCEGDYGGSGIFQYCVGECREALGQYREAAAALRKALDAEPENADYLRKMTDVCQALYDRQGEQAVFDEGIAYASRRLEREPASYDFVNRGLLYVCAGRYEEALKDFLKAGEARRENPYAWINAAYACMMMERYGEALRYAKRAIGLMETEPSTYFYETLGDIYFRMGDYGKALEAFLENRRRYPGRYTTARDLSRVYRKLKRYQEALQVWDEQYPEGQAASRADEQFFIYREMGDLKKAEGAIGAAAYRTGEGSAALRRAELLILRGKLFRAGQALERAVRAYTEKKAGFQEACILTAAYFWLKNKREKARRYAAMALDALLEEWGTETAYLEGRSCRRDGAFSLGMISLFAGEEEKARRYEAAMGEYPQGGGCRDGREKTHCLRAFLLLAEGRDGDAAAENGKALAADPQMAAARLLEAVI